MKQNRILATECCVCHKRKRYHTSGPWIDKSEEHYIGANKNEISHGYCPLCHAKAIENINEYVKHKHKK